MDLELFQRDDWSLRVIERDGEPWFVAADVCRALDLSNVSQALVGLDDDEKGSITIDDGTPGSPVRSIVSEPGLYALVAKSRKPEAKTFRRWVNHEVLPAIRKTGGYAVPAKMPTHAEALRGWADSIERVEELEHQLDEAQPMVALAERAIVADGDFSVREAAHLLQRNHGHDIGERRLFERLRAWAWCDRFNRPYQAHGPNGTGRVTERIQDFVDGAGHERVRTQLRVTVKGITDIIKMLHDETRLPIRVINGGAS